MKRTIALMTLILISMISCCDGEQMIIASGELIARTALFGEDISVVDQEFVLVNNPEKEIVSSIISNPFVNELYATSCIYQPGNSILLESVMIQCDKPFTYNGENIPAGMNFIELGGVNPSLDMSQNTVVAFTSDFISAVNFEDEVYLFTLQTSTDDGIMIKASISLQMEI